MITKSLKGFFRNPVFQFDQDSMWYHWDETWSVMIGPYISEEYALFKLGQYCQKLDFHKEEIHDKSR
jgi:hypothetical protein